MSGLDANLIASMQSRLLDLVGQSSGYIESLPKEVQTRIKGLNGLQVQVTSMEKELQSAMLELEKKFFQRLQPLYEKRRQVVQGEVEPSAEEVEAGGKRFEIEAEEASSAALGNEQPLAKGIPLFWLTTIKNNHAVAQSINEDDFEVLIHLADVRMAYLDDTTQGFRLEFEFEPNGFFEQKVLTKTFMYRQDPDSGDVLADQASGCLIDWKEGKDLTKMTVTKKQRSMATNRTRVVTETVPANSFFTFFESHKAPEDEEAESDMEEEVLLERDFMVGEEFRDHLIPHAVDWFTGKALKPEDLEYDNEFDDEDEDEDEDDEDEEEDDEEEEEGAQGPNTPNCNQQ